jgi:hypothetical protein
MRVADLVAELAAREDSSSRAEAAVADLKRVVAGLDGERDALQVSYHQYN